MSSPTAEQVARNIAWTLSNSNTELDEMDIAYDTWEIDDQPPTTFMLSVGWYHLETGARGHAGFTVTVAPSEVES